MRRHIRLLAARRMRGVAAVEFALIASVFFMMLIGAIEVGRILWIWNAASEATRFGARMAVVCGLDDTQIRVRMRERLTALGDGNISLSYLPASCAATCPVSGSCTGAVLCESVTVTLTGLTPDTFIPYAGFRPTLPPFRTTLSREYMVSAANPACE